MLDARSDTYVFAMNRPFKVLVSLVTLVAFLFNVVSYDLAWAARDSAGLPSVGSERAGGLGSIKELRVDTFMLPAYLGTVQYASSADHGAADTVVHIQDAHCNYAAQKKIAEIIDYLNSEYGINTVNLEGGAKEYDLNIFTDIGDKVVREKVVDHFVNEGTVNGAEYFAANNPEKVTLWGIEDPSLYLKNLNVYKDSLAHKEEVDKVLKSLGHILSNLKPRIYSKALLDFDAKYSQYKANNLPFKDYLEYLVRKAKELAIDVKSFTDIYLLSQAMDAEAQIDFKKANSEREALVDILQKKLSKKSLEELVVKTVEFRSDKLSHREFYSYLAEKAKAVGMDLGLFPELQKYIVYISMYDAIDKTRIMAELEILEDGIRSTLCENDEQRELALLSKNLALLRNFFNISLTRGDYEYYKRSADSFAMSRFVDFISKESPLYKISAKPDNSVNKIDDYLDQMAQFYEYSFLRDDAFMKNIKFSEGKQRTTVVITGGFHTDNLRDLFKKKGISYISVLPNFRSTEGSENKYVGLLEGKEDPVEKQILAIIPSALAIASFLNRLGGLTRGQRAQAAFALHAEWAAAVERGESGMAILDGTKVLGGIDKSGKAVSAKAAAKWPTRPDVAKILASLRMPAPAIAPTAPAPAPAVTPPAAPAAPAGPVAFAEYLALKVSDYSVSTRPGAEVVSIKDIEGEVLPAKFTGNEEEQRKQVKDFGVELWKKGAAQVETVTVSGRKIEVIVDKELGLTGDAIGALMQEALARSRGDVNKLPPFLVITLLNKSTHMFEDHIANGFIGVNSCVMALDDPVKKIMLKVGLVHELSHELTGRTGSEFEAAQLVRDALYASELMAELGVRADTMAEGLSEYLKDTRFMQAVKDVDMLRLAQSERGVGRMWKYRSDIVNALMTPVGALVGYLKIQNFKDEFNGRGADLGISNALGDAALNVIGRMLKVELAARLRQRGIECEVYSRGPEFFFIVRGATDDDRQLVQSILNNLLADGSEFRKSVVEMTKKELRKFVSSRDLARISEGLKEFTAAAFNMYGGLSEVRTGPEASTEDAVKAADLLGKQAARIAKFGQMRFAAGYDQKIAEAMDMAKDREFVDRAQKMVAKLLYDAKKSRTSGVSVYTADSEYAIKSEEQDKALENEYASVATSIAGTSGETDALGPILERYKMAIADNDRPLMQRLKYEAIRKIVAYGDRKLSANKEMIFLGNNDIFNWFANYVFNKRPAGDIRCVFRLGENSDEYAAIVWNGRRKTGVAIRLDGNNIGAISTQLGPIVADEVISRQLKAINDIIASGGDINSIPAAIEDDFVRDPILDKDGKPAVLYAAYSVIEKEKDLRVSDLKSKPGELTVLDQYGNPIRISVEYSNGDVRAMNLNNGEVLSKSGPLLTYTSDGYNVKLKGSILDILTAKYNELRSDKNIRITEEDVTTVVKTRAGPIAMGAVNIDATKLPAGNIDISSIVYGRAGTAAGEAKLATRAFEIMRAGETEPKLGIKWAAAVDSAEHIGHPTFFDMSEAESEIAGAIADLAMANTALEGLKAGITEDIKVLGELSRAVEIFKKYGYSEKAAEAENAPANMYGTLITMGILAGDESEVQRRKVLADIMRMNIESIMPPEIIKAATGDNDEDLYSVKRIAVAYLSIHKEAMLGGLPGFTRDGAALFLAKAEAYRSGRLAGKAVLRENAERRVRAARMPAAAVPSLEMVGVDAITREHPAYIEKKLDSPQARERVRALELYLLARDLQADENFIRLVAKTEAIYTVPVEGGARTKMSVKNARRWMALSPEEKAKHAEENVYYIEQLRVARLNEEFKKLLSAPTEAGAAAGTIERAREMLRDKNIVQIEFYMRRVAELRDALADAGFYFDRDHPSVMEGKFLENIGINEKGDIVIFDIANLTMDKNREISDDDFNEKLRANLTDVTGLTPDQYSARLQAVLRALEEEERLQPVSVAPATERERQAVSIAKKSVSEEKPSETKQEKLESMAAAFRSFGVNVRGVEDVMKLVEALGLLSDNIIKQRLQESPLRLIRGPDGKPLRDAKGRIVSLRGRSMLVYEFVDPVYGSIIVKFPRTDKKADGTPIKPEDVAQLQRDIASKYDGAKSKLGRRFVPEVIENLRFTIEDENGKTRTVNVPFAIIQTRVLVMDEALELLRTEDENIEADKKEKIGRLGPRPGIMRRAQRREYDAEMARIKADADKDKAKVVAKQNRIWDAHAKLREEMTKHGVLDKDSANFKYNYGFLSYDPETREYAVDSLVGFDADWYEINSDSKLYPDMWAGVPSVFTEEITNRSTGIILRFMDMVQAGATLDPMTILTGIKRTGVEMRPPTAPPAAPPAAGFTPASLFGTSRGAALTASWIEEGARTIFAMLGGTAFAVFNLIFVLFHYRVNRADYIERYMAANPLRGPPSETSVFFGTIAAPLFTTAISVVTLPLLANPLAYLFANAILHTGINLILTSAGVIITPSVLITPAAPIAPPAVAPVLQPPGSYIRGFVKKAREAEEEAARRAARVPAMPITPPAAEGVRVYLKDRGQRIVQRPVLNARIKEGRILTGLNVTGETFYFDESAADTYIMELQNYVRSRVDPKLKSQFDEIISRIEEGSRKAAVRAAYDILRMEGISSDEVLATVAYYAPPEGRAAIKKMGDIAGRVTEIEGFEERLSALAKEPLGLDVMTQRLLSFLIPEAANRERICALFAIHLQRLRYGGIDRNDKGLLTLENALGAVAEILGDIDISYSMRTLASDEKAIERARLKVEADTGMDYDSLILYADELADKQRDLLTKIGFKVVETVEELRENPRSIWIERRAKSLYSIALKAGFLTGEEKDEPIYDYIGMRVVLSSDMDAIRDLSTIIALAVYGKDGDGNPLWEPMFNEEKGKYKLKVFNFLQEQKDDQLHYRGFNLTFKDTKGLPLELQIETSGQRDINNNSHGFYKLNKLGAKIATSMEPTHEDVKDAEASFRFLKKAFGPGMGLTVSPIPTAKRAAAAVPIQEFVASQPKVVVDGDGAIWMVDAKTGKRIKQIGKDWTLLRQGEEGDYAYYIEDGEVDVYEIVDGKEVPMKVDGKPNVVGKGQYIGELALLTGLPRTKTIKVKPGAEVVLRGMSRDDIFYMMAQYGEFRKYLEDAFLERMNRISAAGEVTYRNLVTRPATTFIPREALPSTAPAAAGNPEDYFKVTPGSVRLLISALDKGHEPSAPTLEEARRRMRDAAQGRGEKREPISVVEILDDTGKPTGRYLVEDGNTTVTAAIEREFNLREVIAVVAVPKPAVAAAPATPAREPTTARPYLPYIDGIVRPETLSKLNLDDLPIIMDNRVFLRIRAIYRKYAGYREDFYGLHFNAEVIQPSDSLIGWRTVFERSIEFLNKFYNREFKGVILGPRDMSTVTIKHEIFHDVNYYKWLSPKSDKALKDLAGELILFIKVFSQLDRKFGWAWETLAEGVRAVDDESTLDEFIAYFFSGGFINKRSPEAKEPLEYMKRAYAYLRDNMPAEARRAFYELGYIWPSTSIGMKEVEPADRTLPYVSAQQALRAAALKAVLNAPAGPLRGYSATVEFEFRGKPDSEIEEEMFKWTVRGVASRVDQLITLWERRIAARALPPAAPTTASPAAPVSTPESIIAAWKYVGANGAEIHHALDPKTISAVLDIVRARPDVLRRELEASPAILAKLCLIYEHSTPADSAKNVAAWIDAYDKKIEFKAPAAGEVKRAQVEGLSWSAFFDYMSGKPIRDRTSLSLIPYLRYAIVEGIHNIEIPFDFLPFGIGARLAGEYSDAELEEIRSLCEKYGITITIHSPLVGPLNSKTQFKKLFEDAADNIPMMQEQIRIGGRMGAKMMVVHVVSPERASDYAGLVLYARQYAPGLRIVFENYSNKANLFPSAEDFMKDFAGIVRQVAAKDKTALANIGIVIDTAHYNLTGREDPIASAFIIAEGVWALGRELGIDDKVAMAWLSELHVNQNMGPIGFYGRGYSADIHSRASLEGPINNLAVVALLAVMGFNPEMTLEQLSPPDEGDIKLINEARALPGKRSFDQVEADGRAILAEIQRTRDLRGLIGMQVADAARVDDAYRAYSILAGLIGKERIEKHFRSRVYQKLVTVRSREDFVKLKAALEGFGLMPSGMDIEEGAGKEIIRQGDRVDLDVSHGDPKVIYLILEGSAMGRIAMTDPVTKQVKVTPFEVKPGNFVGEIALLTAAHERTASISMGDKTVAIAISLSAIKEISELIPNFAELMKTYRDMREEADRARLKEAFAAPAAPRAPPAVTPASLFGTSRGAAIAASWVEEWARTTAATLGGTAFAVFNLIFVLFHYRINRADYIERYMDAYPLRGPPSKTSVFFGTIAAPLFTTAISVVTLPLLANPLAYLFANAILHTGINLILTSAGVIITPSSLIRAAAPAKVSEEEEMLSRIQARWIAAKFLSPQMTLDRKIEALRKYLEEMRVNRLARDYVMSTIEGIDAKARKSGARVSGADVRGILNRVDTRRQLRLSDTQMENVLDIFAEPGTKEEMVDRMIAALRKTGIEAGDVAVKALIDDLNHQYDVAIAERLENTPLSLLQARYASSGPLAIYEVKDSAAMVMVPRSTAPMEADNIEDMQNRYLMARDALGGELFAARLVIGLKITPEGEKARIAPYAIVVPNVVNMVELYDSLQREGEKAATEKEKADIEARRAALNEAYENLRAKMLARGVEASPLYEDYGFLIDPKTGEYDPDRLVCIKADNLKVNVNKELYPDNWPFDPRLFAEVFVKEEAPLRIARFMKGVRSGIAPDDMWLYLLSEEEAAAPPAALAYLDSIKDRVPLSIDGSKPMEYDDIKSAIGRGEIVYDPVEQSLRFADDIRRARISKLWYHGTSAKGLEELIFGKNRGAISNGLLRKPNLTPDESYASFYGKRFDQEINFVFEFDFSADTLEALTYFGRDAVSVSVAYQDRPAVAPPLDSKAVNAAFYKSRVHLYNSLPLSMLSQRNKIEVIRRFINRSEADMRILADSLGMSYDDVSRIRQELSAIAPAAPTPAPGIMGYARWAKLRVNYFGKGIKPASLFGTSRGAAIAASWVEEQARTIAAMLGGTVFAVFNLIFVLLHYRVNRADYIERYMAANPLRGPPSETSVFFGTIAAPLFTTAISVITLPLLANPLAYFFVNAILHTGINLIITSPGVIITPSSLTGPAATMTEDAVIAKIRSFAGPTEFEEFMARMEDKKTAIKVLLMAAYPAQAPPDLPAWSQGRARKILYNMLEAQPELESVAKEVANSLYQAMPRKGPVNPYLGFVAHRRSISSRVMSLREIGLVADQGVMTNIENYPISAGLKITAEQRGILRPGKDAILVFNLPDYKLSGAGLRHTGDEELSDAYLNALDPEYRERYMMQQKENIPGDRIAQISAEFVNIRESRRLNDQLLKEGLLSDENYKAVMGYLDRIEAEWISKARELYAAPAAVSIPEIPEISVTADEESFRLAADALPIAMGIVKSTYILERSAQAIFGRSADLAKGVRLSHMFSKHKEIVKASFTLKDGRNVSIALYFSKPSEKQGMSIAGHEAEIASMVASVDAARPFVPVYGVKTVVAGRDVYTTEYIVGHDYSELQAELEGICGILGLKGKYLRRNEGITEKTPPDLIQRAIQRLIELDLISEDEAKRMNVAELRAFAQQLLIDLDTQAIRTYTALQNAIKDKVSLADLRAENLLAEKVDGRWAFKAVDYESWRLQPSDPSRFMGNFEVFNEKEEGGMPYLLRGWYWSRLEDKRGFFDAVVSAFLTKEEGYAYLARAASGLRKEGSFFAYAVQLIEDYLASVRPAAAPAIPTPATVPPAAPAPPEKGLVVELDPAVRFELVGSGVTRKIENERYEAIIRQLLGSEMLRAKGDGLKEVYPLADTIVIKRVTYIRSGVEKDVFRVEATIDGKTEIFGLRVYRTPGDHPYENEQPVIAKSAEDEVKQFQRFRELDGVAVFVKAMISAKNFENPEEDRRNMESFYNQLSDNHIGAFSFGEFIDGTALDEITGAKEKETAYRDAVKTVVRGWLLTFHRETGVSIADLYGKNLVRREDPRTVGEPVQYVDLGITHRYGLEGLTDQLCIMYVTAGLFDGVNDERLMRLLGAAMREEINEFFAHEAETKILSREGEIGLSIRDLKKEVTPYMPILKMIEEGGIPYRKAAAAYYDNLIVRAAKPPAAPAPAPAAPVAVTPREAAPAAPVAVTPREAAPAVPAVSERERQALSIAEALVSPGKGLETRQERLKSIAAALGSLGVKVSVEEVEALAKEVESISDDIIRQRLQGKTLRLLRAPDGEIVGDRGATMVVYELIDPVYGQIVIKFTRDFAVNKEKAREVARKYEEARKRLGNLFAPHVIEGLKLAIPDENGRLKRDEEGKLILDEITFAIIQTKVLTVDDVISEMIAKEASVVDIDAKRKALKAALSKLEIEMAKLGVTDEDEINRNYNYGFLTFVAATGEYDNLVAFDADRFSIRDGQYPEMWAAAPEVFREDIKNKAAEAIRRFINARLAAAALLAPAAPLAAPAAPAPPAAPAAKKSTDELLRGMGLSDREIVYLTGYVAQFLSDPTRSRYYEQNADELIASLADPRRLSIALRPTKKKPGQTKEEWAQAIVHHYTASHREFINKMDKDVRNKIYGAKLGSKDNQGRIAALIGELLSIRDSLSKSEQEFLSGPTGPNPFARGVKLVDVEDFSGARGFDEGGFTNRIVLERNGKRLAIFLKGVGKEVQKYPIREGRRTEPNEAFFFELAKILGMDTVVSVYYASDSDPATSGVTFMQEIKGEDTNKLFDMAQPGREFRRIRPEYERYKDKLIREFARFAALADMLHGKDRKIANNVTPMYDANYMVNLDGLGGAEDIIYSIDHVFIFLDKNPVIEDIENGVQDEIGIVAAFDEFFTDAGERARMLKDFEEAYLKEWGELLAKKDEIRELILEMYGRWSKELEIFSEAIREDSGEAYVKAQRNAIAQFAPDNVIKLLKENPEQGARHYLSLRTQARMAVWEGLNEAAREWLRAFLEKMGQKPPVVYDKSLYKKGTYRTVVTVSEGAVSVAEYNEEGIIPGTERIVKAGEPPVSVIARIGAGSFAVRTATQVTQVYAPGTYRTTITVSEGAVSIATYDESGKMVGDEISLGRGQIASITGRVEPPRLAVPAAPKPLVDFLNREYPGQVTGVKTSGPGMTEISFANGIPPITLPLDVTEAKAQEAVNKHINLMNEELIKIAKDLVAYMMQRGLQEKDFEEPVLRAQLIELASVILNAKWVNGKRVNNGQVAGELALSLADLPMPQKIKDMGKELTKKLAGMGEGAYYNSFEDKALPSIISVAPARIMPTAELEERRIEAVNALITPDNPGAVVKVVVGVPAGEGPGKFNDLNRILRDLGLGPRGSRVQDAHVVVFEIFEGESDRTLKSMNAAIARAGITSEDQGRVVIFAPQMEKEGVMLADNTKAEYGDKTHITIVPDAYSDLKMLESLLPDLMARVALARNIAYYNATADVEAKDNTLNTIRDLLNKITIDGGAIFAIEDGKIRFPGLLRIRPVNYKNIKDWHDMQEKIAASA